MTAAFDWGDDDDLPAVFRGVRYTRCGLYEAPAWYDVDYAGYRGEDSFYRFLLARHVRVGAWYVELGAGTGRLCLPYAIEGVQVHAVEPAPAMAQHLRRRRDERAVPATQLVVEEATAATFTGPPAALVAFPFNGVMHVPTRAALSSSFVHVRTRLAPDGRFALDCTGPYWETMRRGPRASSRVDERVHPTRGTRLWTVDRSSYDATTRTMRILIRFVEEGVDDGVELVLEQTMWTWQEILAALDDAGFVVEHLFGDVDLRPFVEGSPRLLVSTRAR